MKFINIIALFVMLFASKSLAGSPVIWGPGCAYNLYTSACIAAGSSAVTSVFTRTGAVVAASGDYSSFYPLISNNLSDLQSVSTARTNLGCGTFSLPALTAGSVLFSDGSTIAQDNTKIFWDDTKFELSIGGHLHTAGLGISQSGGTDVGIDLTTTTANTAFQVENQGAELVGELTTSSNSSTQGGILALGFSRGTISAKTAVQAGDEIGGIVAQSYNGTSFGPGFNGAIGFIATENQTGSANGGEFVVETTPNTTLAPVLALAIGQDQTASFSKGVYVNGGVAATNAALVFKDGHLKSTRTTAPTVTINANAGTGATCTIAHASDVAGTVTIISGSVGTPTTGDQCQINFNKAYAVAPICIIQPANATAGTDLVQSYVDNSTVSTTIATIAFAVAAATTATYIYNYNCIETQ